MDPVASGSILSMLAAAVWSSAAGFADRAGSSTLHA
jgi:hypothetical protein